MAMFMVKPWYKKSGDKYKGIWVPKTWQGASASSEPPLLLGNSIWNDGTQIYFDYAYYLYSNKISWLTDLYNKDSTFDGRYVWTDDNNIYYSNGNTHKRFIIDSRGFKFNHWNDKTWDGITSFYGSRIWTDGDDIYYSYNNTQKILDKSTSTWYDKTWYGLPDWLKINGENIWTDGENIYFTSSGTTNYVLDKATSTWSAVTCSNLGSYSDNGSYIWTDKENIYFSRDTNQKILDKENSTRNYLIWQNKTWDGLTSFKGQYVWTDGENIYYSLNYDQYQLT